MLLQLLTMDALVSGTMKDAAKCVKHCERQNFANQEKVECTLRAKIILYLGACLVQSVIIFLFEVFNCLARLAGLCTRNVKAFFWYTKVM